MGIKHIIVIKPWEALKQECYRLISLGIMSSRLILVVTYAEFPSFAGAVNSNLLCVYTTSSSCIHHSLGI